eukprot:sb/3464543/
MKADAMSSLSQLEEVKRTIEAERQAALDELTRNREQLARDQEERMAAQLATLEESLAVEREEQAEANRKLVERLSKRKEEMVAEVERKRDEKVKAMKAKGASPEELDQLIGQHNEEVQKLTNKLDADKLRQQQKLQAQIDRRRAKQKSQAVDKIKQESCEVVVGKKGELEENFSKIQKHASVSNVSNRISLIPYTDKILSVVSLPSSSQLPAVAGPVTTASTLEMTVPLSDSQLQSLLLPLENKIGSIAEQLGKAHSESYVSELNSKYAGGKELKPVDISNLSVRDFTVYKFGAYICELSPVPIVLLLASETPANHDFIGNAYRCSRVLFDHKSKDEIFLRNVQEAFEVKLVEEERTPDDHVTHLAALGSVRKVMDSTAQISEKKRWAPRTQQAVGEIIRLLLELAKIDKTYSTTHLSDTLCGQNAHLSDRNHPFFRVLRDFVSLFRSACTLACTI